MIVGKIIILATLLATILDFGLVLDQWQFLRDDQGHSLLSLKGNRLCCNCVGAQNKVILLYTLMIVFGVSWVE